jgi:hypothetical protein
MFIVNEGISLFLLAQKPSFIVRASGLNKWENIFPKKIYLAHDEPT